MNFTKDKKGFTLLELMISILIFSVGVVGIYFIIPNIISATSNNTNNFVASQLAREGLEVVRNIRDANWLNQRDWDNGLSDGNWRVEYDKEDLLTMADQFLLKDSSGFYNYNMGSPTVYKRTINISHLSADSMEVTATVTWPRAEFFSYAPNVFVLKEVFYDWR